jgi:hypothetical protein
MDSGEICGYGIRMNCTLIKVCILRSVLLGLLMLSSHASGDIDISRTVDIYTDCLRSKQSLRNGTCWNMRNWILENGSHAEKNNIIGGIISKSGVSTYYYSGKDGELVGVSDNTPISDKAKCEKTAGLLGYYDPKRRTIIVCENNLGTVIDGIRQYGNAEADFVTHHELIHAAQHCYGGTLSRNPYIKSRYFSRPPGPEDIRTVVELYPEGQWVDEIEARAGVVNGLEIDYATLLYIACKGV